MMSGFLTDEITSAVGKVYPEVFLPHFQVLPSEHADFASNVAMILAGSVGESPRDVAGKIVEALEKRELFRDSVEAVEIAGPGFLNFTLGRPLLVAGMQETLRDIEQGAAFLMGREYNLEFISANPTGKLHIGHGRGAFFGDALANVLAYAGAFITREYFINNSRESKQIIELGKTALGVGEQYKTPALSAKIEALDFTDCGEKEAGARLAAEVQKENAEFVTKTLGISFDRWFDEDEMLTASGQIEKMLTELREKKLTYSEDGAEWIKTSEYGDDEDRVVVRSDGTASYFLSDITYHHDKFSRGLDSVLNVWGADHGGHVKRMLAVKKMLQWQGELHIFISQMVMLKGEGGERVKMSKRAGNVVLLEDLVSDIDIDAARWFFLEKSLSTQMDFDLELARESSEKNPVRYVQYAHARMCSIVRKSGKASENEREAAPFKEIFENKQAHLLAVKLIQFPEAIEEITRNYGVHKLTTYVYDLAGVFSGFYRDVRVIKEDGSVNEEALEMVVATKKVLAKSLELLGVSAPEEM